MLRIQEPLYVVCMISNPIRFSSRYKLYEKFKKYVEDAGAKLLTVEVSFGERPLQVTEASDPMNLSLRTVDELWHKENAINLGIQYLTSKIDPDWKYVAWVDADVQFSRPDWVAETIDLLQHYEVIQMFSHAIDLDPNYNSLVKSDGALKVHNGFIWSYMKNEYQPPTNGHYSNYGQWHPGFAWAANRRFWDRVGGLIDFAILGSADRHMALALIGAANLGFPPDMSRGYKESLEIWSNRCTAHIRQDVGYMEGMVLHQWHGKKVDRQYGDRWKILTANQYDPEFHLKRDAQGLWQLVPEAIRLRDDIRAYFRARHEDSIDVE